MRTPPTLTIEQRTTALARAGWVRTCRAETKEHWKEIGHDEAIEEFATLLANGVPDWARSWRLEMALRSIPKIGPTSAAKLLSKMEVAPNRRLGGLTVRQRLLVADTLKALGA